MNSVEYLLLVGGDGSAEHKVLRGLGGRNPTALTEAGSRPCAVLTRFLNVTVARSGSRGEVEGDGDAAGSIVAAGGGDVLHALGAVDLLLQRNGDRAFYRLCAGTGVETGDADRGGARFGN